VLVTLCRALAYPQGKLLDGYRGWMVIFGQKYIFMHEVDISGCDGSSFGRI